MLSDRHNDNELYCRLLDAHAEAVRQAARTTRLMAIAAASEDREGFSAALAQFYAAKYRGDGLLMAMQICRELMNKGVPKTPAASLPLSGSFAGLRDAIPR